MYKININDSTLYLISSDDLINVNKKEHDMVVPYKGKTKILLSYIDMLEKTKSIKSVVIHFDDLKRLKTDFESLFVIIKASGGVVEEENGNILMIFRRGHWDLPKGKIEAGEKKKAAAIREVIEETGVSEVSIASKILTTRHTYRLKSKRRVIKKTYWYAMRARNQKLIPQIVEDIEKAKWVNPSKFITGDLPIYSNIIDVLKASGYLD